MSRRTPHSSSGKCTPTPQDSSDTQSGGVSKRVRVLVAEDELLNRTVIERVLENNGYEVHTATDGCIALDLAEQKRPQIIILDLSMPAMDGLEVLRIIRSGERNIPVDIPVIVLTGFDEMEIDAACRVYDVVDVVLKPVSMDALLQILKSVELRGED